MAEDELPKKFSYNLDNLRWDAAHHFNEQNRYSYTGRGRKLGDPALQCERCMQWFHAKDTSCVPEEVGFVPFQRNYRFTCRVCTGAKELFEVLPNTWSSIVLTAVYNLLLSDDRATIGESRKTASVKDIVEWIQSHWGSLTSGRSLPQLLENNAVPKCLHHSHNAGLLIVSADKTEVSLRSLAHAKLHLKPLLNGTVAANAAVRRPAPPRPGAPAPPVSCRSARARPQVPAKPKARDAAGSSGSKRKRGGGQRGGANKRADAMPAVPMQVASRPGMHA